MIVRALFSPWGIRAALLAVALVAAVALYGRGYDAGRDAAEARAAIAQEKLSARLEARTAALAAATAEIDRARAARAADIERIENEALAAPDAARRALSADSVRRLRDRWSDGE